MKTHSFLLACAALVALAGCGRNVAYVIRPVPADERLRETVVQTDPGWVTDKIALLDVEGLIVNERTSPLFGEGENPVALLDEKLTRARSDEHVKAVVLRINSPGGTVQASELMHELVGRFRKQTGRPVVSCITDVGASGAYYLACAGQPILCQDSSITGSIGVIVQTVSFAGTMRMIGVSAKAIVSGPLKDMGSPLKELTDEEQKVFQEMVDQFFEQFVAVVAQGRSGLSVQQVRALADGRVYTGRQALKLGLADRLGGVQEAIDQAKRAAGVKKAKVVMYHRPLGYRANVYSSAAAPQPGTQINLLNLQGSELMFLRRPMFLYLWSTDLPGGAGNR